jgi:hypothetical protein
MSLLIEPVADYDLGRSPMAEAATAIEFSPQDVIVALLANMRGGEGKFRADAVRIHKALARLKQEAQYKELFKGLVFDRRDYFPYSEYLEETLDALQLAGYLDRTNPRGVYYQVRPSLFSMFDREIKRRFKAEQLELLEAASTEFFTEIMS